MTARYVVMGAWAKVYGETNDIAEAKRIHDEHAVRDVHTRVFDDNGDSVDVEAE